MSDEVVSLHDGCLHAYDVRSHVSGAQLLHRGTGAHTNLDSSLVWDTVGGNRSCRLQLFPIEIGVDPFSLVPCEFKDMLDAIRRPELSLRFIIAQVDNVDCEGATSKERKIYSDFLTGTV